MFANVFKRILFVLVRNTECNPKYVCLQEYSTVYLERKMSGEGSVAGLN